MTTQLENAIRACPKRAQHKVIPAARCDGCGVTIPVGPYTSELYALYFDEPLVSSVGWRSQKR
jgi:hypothetical protein